MEYLKRKPPAHSLEHRQPPTELANFSKQDMLQLYTEFTEGPEHPRQLYDVDVGNASLRYLLSKLTHSLTHSLLFQ